MYKIQTFNNLAAKGLDRFPSVKYQVGPDLSSANALMLRSQKLHDESIDESVIAVARAGAGVRQRAARCAGIDPKPIFHIRRIA